MAENHVEVLFDDNIKIIDHKLVNATLGMVRGVLEGACLFGEGTWVLKDSRRIRKKGRERFRAIRLESKYGSKSIRIWCRPMGNDTSFEYSLVPPQETDIEMAYSLLLRVNPITMKIPESTDLPGAFVERVFDVPPMVLGNHREKKIECVEVFDLNSDEAPRVPDHTEGMTRGELGPGLMPDPSNILDQVKEMIKKYELSVLQAGELKEVIEETDKAITRMDRRAEEIRREEDDISKEMARLAQNLEEAKNERIDLEKTITQKKEEREEWNRERDPHLAEIERILPILSAIGVKINPNSERSDPLK
jgi:hypothetical protein